MTPDGLLDGLRNTSSRGASLRCLRLHRLEPAGFEELRRDVRQLLAQAQPSTVTESGHVTSWVLPYGQVHQYSLFNSSGRANDFSSDHDLARRDKSVLAPLAYPALASFAARLPDLVNLRVAVLGAGAGLSPHQEHVFVRAPSGHVVPRVRFHLPLETTPNALLVLDDDAFWLEPGTTHLVNHGCVHAAHNGGPRPRVHLVWDQVLTAEAFSLMLGDSPVDPPWRRLLGSDRLAPVVLRKRLGAARRLPPQVSAADIDKAVLAPEGWDQPFPPGTQPIRP